MKTPLKLLCLLLWLVTASGFCNAAEGKYSYETVPGDPLKARIYTLDNGLKVYLTVNKETPRIQTYIAVRVGGKNDPAETTGLAHYFEHLMFKGTQRYGTLDYRKEKPLLDQIEQCFEVYRKTTDEAQRKMLYHTIDSLSYEASRYAISNEYDKLMAAIGAIGTNAYTAFDQTVYVEDIPSNQVDNWAKIQSDRFVNNVIRGFHTELETVYEEKNMSLTKDPYKVYDATLAALFPHHPYGTQTVLGTQDDLKNPSITNILRYYRTWYVPNNMAVCLSGDLDPDETVAIIDKYFGQMKPGVQLPKLEFTQETPIGQPIVREVLGPDAESLMLAWRFPGAASKELEALRIVSQILYNGKAGLIDLDLNQRQKVLEAYCYPEEMADYSVLMMEASPKQGQTLDQVRQLLLEEVRKLRAGEFDDRMLEAILNNMKLERLQSMESNEGRANLFVNSFITGKEWKDEVTSFDRMAGLTKQDLVAFAKTWLGGDNYAAIYKRRGEDPNEKKMSKPEITPIVMNRDTASAFLKAVQTSRVNPVEPVFLDFDKDLSRLKAKADIPVLYKQNTSNDLFRLIYLFDMGTNHDRALKIAFDYLEYLGTPDMTPEQIKSVFYRLACTFFVSTGNERTFVVLSGLNENMPAALQLFEKLMAEAQVDRHAYTNLTDDILKNRKDAKLNQNENFKRLKNYALYGERSPMLNLIPEAELTGTDPQEFVDRIHRLNGYEHRILYYGPDSPEELLEVVNRYHRIPATLGKVPAGRKFAFRQTPETRILLAPYPANQIYLSHYSNRDEKFDTSVESFRQMYNEYFGGGMNSIVFQEMRESRGLAYYAWASMFGPDKLEYPYIFLTQIATQNDKMIDAIRTFDQIIDSIPRSEAAFCLAKEALLTRLRTERIVKEDVLWKYVHARDLGETTDARIRLFDQVQRMTLQDVVDYQKKWIKGRPFVYFILGDKTQLDMEKLKAIGPVEELTQEQIFGY